MVERGDFVVPRFLGRAFPDKPILFFWAQAASMRVFGMTTAAARLPGLLFALLGVATTGWLTLVLFDRRVAWIAATCYATMVLPFLLAQAPVHDIALVPFTNLALGFLLRARWDFRFGFRDLGCAGLALGLSILTKGLEGVAIVGLAYGAYLLITRTLTRRLVMQGVLAVIVAVLVALPWYVAMNAREPGYLRYYFVDRHLLGFVTDTQRHAGQPWWFYLPVVLAGGLPWLLFVRWRATAGQTLLWTWLVGAVALLSLSQSKAVTYVLPAVPAVAIMAAVSIERVRTWRVALVATAGTYVFALFAFGPSVARTHSSRDLAGYFNAAGQIPPTIFVFDQRVSFVYYLRPELRHQLHQDGVRSVSVEEVAAMHPFPRGAVVTVPIDLATARLPQIPGLANAVHHVAGRYLVVSP